MLVVFAANFAMSPDPGKKWITVEDPFAFYAAIAKRVQVQFKIVQALIDRANINREKGNEYQQDVKQAFAFLAQISDENTGTPAALLSGLKTAQVLLKFGANDQKARAHAFNLLQMILNKSAPSEQTINAIALDALAILEEWANRLDNDAINTLIKCFESNPRPTLRFYAGTILSRLYFIHITITVPTGRSTQGEQTIILGLELLKNESESSTAIAWIYHFTLEIAFKLMATQWRDGSSSLSDVQGAKKARDIIISLLQRWGKVLDLKPVVPVISTMLKTIFQKSENRASACIFLYPLLQALSEQSNLPPDLQAPVNNLLGEIYYHGWGVKKDYARAFRYYTATPLVLIDSLYNLALLYYDGHGTPHNMEKAKDIFLEVIQKPIEFPNDIILISDAYAYLLDIFLWRIERNEEYLNIAEELINGYGTWTEKIGHLGVTDAQFAQLHSVLANIHVSQSEIYYRKGDYKKAFEMLQEIAQQNYNPTARILALIKMADMLHLGRGVARSDLQAEEYYKQAYAQTDNPQLQDLALAGLERLEQEEKRITQHEARMRAIEEETARLKKLNDEFFKDVPKYEQPD
jgi:hypothetical protein